MEFLVLGSQTLTELRDRIICFKDYIIDKDYSECPDAFDRSVMVVPDTATAVRLLVIIGHCVNNMVDECQLNKVPPHTHTPETSLSLSLGILFHQQHILQ